ncbi:MAG: FeoA family protein [Opitutaceae bacterium]
MPAAHRLSSAIPLSRLPAGTDARVLRLEGQDNVCQRLREIGFCESAVISRLAGKTALVCQVCGTRIALHHALGERIHVEPIGATR